MQFVRVPTQTPRLMPQLVTTRIAASRAPCDTCRIWNADNAMNAELRRRPGGTYEEILGGDWTAEYGEDPPTGLWEVVVLKHGTAEWRETGYPTIDDARRAAREFYDQI